MRSDSRCRGLRTALFLGLAALVVGCGQRPGSAKVVSVTGRVFLDDQPLEFGQVMFQPIRGGQPATGKILPDGSFRLATYGKEDGAPVGRHRVRVVCYTSQSPDAEPSVKNSESLGELLIPERYANLSTSGIEVSVLEGGNAPFILKLDGETSENSSRDSIGIEPTESTEPSDDGSPNPPKMPGSDAAAEASANPETAAEAREDEK